MKIQEETAQRLFELIRMCHPNEHGEPYNRGEVIEEIQIRGLQVLKDLGWKTTFNTIWKNRYTGHEVTFANQMCFIKSESQKARKEGMFHELPFLIENWTPIDLWTDVDCMDKYKPKATLGGWMVKKNEDNK